MMKRTTLFRCSIAFFLGISASICARAKTDIPEWLQAALKEDHSGWEESASSLVLLDSGEINYLPEGKLKKVFRSAVRLNKQDGLAEVFPGLPYDANTDKILNLRAWIISPDGKKIKSYGRADFIDVSAQLDEIWTAERVVTFNRKEAVGVGGVLAWELQVEAQSGMSDCRWPFRMRQPVLASIFTVTPLPRGKLVSHAASQQTPKPETGETPGSLRWTMRRIHPLPTTEEDSEFCPTPLTISVRCISDDNLSGRLETWGSFAGLAADIVEPQIVADATVTAKAIMLAKGQNGRWERIRAITEYVQKQISYLSVSLGKDSLAGYRPHLPAEVIKNGLGDCKDKATLTAALLRQLGEKAWVVLLNSGHPREVEPEWPSASFNHAIVGITAGDDAPPGWPQIDGGVLGKLILFDATDPATPLGGFAQSDQGGYGLVVSKQTTGLVALPMESPAENKLSRTVTGKLTESGNVEAEVEEIRTGSNGAIDHFIRINQGSEKFTHSLETRLHETMPLIHGLKWKDDWSAPGACSRLNYSFAAEHVGQQVGSEILLVCPRLLNRRLRQNAWPKREEGLFWLPARGIHEVVTLQLPDRSTTETLPAAWQQTLASGTASVSYRLSGQTLTYEFNLEQKAGLFGQAEYEQLQIFYEKIDEAERRAIIVRRPQNHS
jgi:hypothetical protein